MSTPSALELLQASDLRAKNGVWELGLVTLPGPAKGKPPVQVVLCVSSEASGASMPLTAGRPEPDDVFTALYRAAADAPAPGARPLGHLPKTLRVQAFPPSIMEPLRALAEARGVTVEVKQRLERLEQIAEGLAQFVAESALPGGGPEVPALMDSPGMTRERVAAFALAAQAFNKAAPWSKSKDEQMWSIDSPRAGFVACSPMGGLGEAFGLALFTSVAQVDSMLQGDAEHPSENRARLRPAVGRAL